MRARRQRAARPFAVVFGRRLPEDLRRGLAEFAGTLASPPAGAGEGNAGDEAVASAALAR